MTFLPAYLRELGLSGREISTVFAVPPLLAMVVPLAWAYLADRTHRHARILRIVVGGAWLCFVPMLFARSFAAILASWALYAMFAVAVGGLADALRRRARARRRGVRADAAVGLGRVRHRGACWSARCCPRAAARRIGWSRSRCGWRSAARSRRRCGCAARASRRRARAPPTSRRCSPTRACACCW